MNPADYSVELKLRLDWSELDLFGHINNVSFFKYVQASRVNYWDQMGLTQLHSEMEVGPMLAQTTCKFKQPLFYPGSISIHARITSVKTTSFVIEHVIVNDKGEIAAEAEDVVVVYDFKKGEKVPIPENIREMMESR